MYKKAILRIQTYIPFLLCSYAVGFVSWDIWEMEAFNLFSSYARQGLLWNLIQSGEPIYFGWGAFLFSIGLIFLLGRFLTKLGFFSGNRFLSNSILLIFALLFLFILFPVAKILALGIPHFWNTIETYGRAGEIFANTLWLSVAVSIGSTLVGLCFALLIVRSRHTKTRGLWRIFSMLPLITPPFVVGLSLIFLFGRAGLITNNLLGIETNMIIGFPGLALAQIFSFAPISFMVIAGVLQGIDPTLEEASATLGGNDFRTFRHITWNLLRPGLANSFLLTMIESFADFANPIIIGGDYHVLSTEIYFAVVGKYDEGLAASLGFILLLSTLAFFTLQRLWLGKKSYVTVSGKPQGRVLPGLPAKLDNTLFGFATLWSLATFALYLFFFLGAFVKVWGINYTFTTEHFRQFFSDGIDSFRTSIFLALAAAPLTSILGLLIAYLTHRQRFWGRSLMEFISLVNFAIPGTVIGIGYLLAFNKDPFHMTGTAMILIFCFVFRNMAVGLRAGIASLSQIDQNLEEASLTLGAGIFTTLRRVLFPLLREATISAMAYSFVRAITAISAIVFLVSAEWNLATKVILDRIEYGKLGVAAAYSTILVVLMGGTLIFTQWFVKRLAGHRADMLTLERKA